MSSNAQKIEQLCSALYQEYVHRNLIVYLFIVLDSFGMFWMLLSICRKKLLSFWVVHRMVHQPYEESYGTIDLVTTGGAPW